MTSGLLGDCKTTDEPRPFVPDAESAELHHLLEVGAKAERDSELDKFARDRLCNRYKEHIDELGRIAPKTFEKYLRVFGAFASECDEAGVSCLPATPGAVATYLDHKLSNGASAETIRVITAAIARAHLVSEFPDPTTDPLVRGIVRASGKQPRKKLNGKAH